MAEQQQEGPAERTYPNIEIFLETQDRSAVETTFAATKEALAALPKIKAEQGKRALAAIEQTEALLQQLFDVKDRLVEEAATPKKSRR